ncbi:serine/threonine-protein kinase ULK3-like isoform X2 [Zootermopsis nevadensis]|uniref:Serine/threonine-protein kinase ULK3 n=1 Tax=Zootermopsis nevadensis TaxID=136037 RepID=A0A067RA22_ZOONE|nr:serine/threonine-protein kinase ULK3-like isoform X2 [Zootermopsis nevadensis]KDR19557.1 Serine/threonine-protein kinase ULK3 [Zootermopsis nevadensis]
MSVPQLRDYTLVERLGSGSYATVYKGFKKNGPREVVAVKCVEKKQLSGAAVDNIITEITLLKLLKHEYIVEMKDFQWDERYIFIIMEYCQHGDLSCFIRKRRKLPETICRKFLQQLALALKFLRSHSVCHMDLKPQNLLLTSQPTLTLKLADFGFAQYLSSDDQNSSLRGSPLYMAPEILLKHKYDARVDLWSVGVIMYECLFGRAPYSSNNFKELAEKIKSQMAIQVPLGSKISSACRDLLMSLLQHDPDKRIDYEAFFQHSFLDLEHMPTAESYHKAVDLVCNAVKHDTEKNFVAAFNLYCDSLRYFIPLINAEVDVNKKAAMRSKVNEYIRRAEDLKRIVYAKEEPGVGEQLQSYQKMGTIDFTELCHLCTGTPAMIAALEIASSAEQYVAEGHYQKALDKFQSCLGILIPLLSNEPKGHRRDLLYSQIHLWMKQAESTKALLCVLDLDDASIPENKELCCIQ